MPKSDAQPAPLSDDQCAMLEMLSSRGVEACAASSPNNLPGWVYAGRSQVFDVSLLLVAFRATEPHAAAFIQRILQRVNELALEYYRAQMVESGSPHASTR